MKFTPDKFSLPLPFQSPQHSTSPYYSDQCSKSPVIKTTENETQASNTHLQSLSLSLNHTLSHAISSHSRFCLLLRFENHFSVSLCFTQTEPFYLRAKPSFTFIAFFLQNFPFFVAFYAHNFLLIHKPFFFASFFETSFYF